MNLKSVLLTVATVFTVSSIFAQANILNAKSPEEIGVRTAEQKANDNDKPLEYGYVDDRDKLFDKMYETYHRSPNLKNYLDTKKSL